MRDNKTCKDCHVEKGPLAKIIVSQEDFDFLKELQHELLTQTNDGNADPVYWGVMESTLRGVPDGCGDPIIYMGDGGTMDAAEAVEYIRNEYLGSSARIRQEWAEIDKNDMYDVVRFMNETLGWHEVRVVYQRREEFISRNTGAFLTKRACQEYIDRYGYNHGRPHTYAMTAFRNFELEHLLKILKTMELKEV